MSWYARLSFVVGVSLLVLLPGTRASADPIGYILFNTSTLAELGAFTVDPDLAAPAGMSNVDMTALTFTATVPPFGPLTVTLDDLPTAFRAKFWDGQIFSVTGLGSGTLMGGIDFFLDFTPFTPADPSLINLNAVGTFALDAGMDGVIGDSATGSLGIRPDTVPEPGTALLLATAMLGLWGRRRRSSDSNLGS